MTFFDASAELPGAVGVQAGKDVLDVFDEERGSSREVIDNDADVVHPLDRHVLKRSDPDGISLMALRPSAFSRQRAPRPF